MAVHLDLLYRRKFARLVAEEAVVGWVDDIKSRYTHAFEICEPHKKAGKPVLQAQDFECGERRNDSDRIGRCVSVQNGDIWNAVVALACSSPQFRTDADTPLLCAYMKERT